MTACLLAAALAASPPDGLAAVIEPIAAAHKGQVAVAVKHLGTSEAYARNADTPMQTASLIKLAIMAATYKQADDGKVDLGKMVALTKGDRLDIRPVGRGCSQQAWPNFETACLRKAGAKTALKVEARVVTTDHL